MKIVLAKYLEVFPEETERLRGVGEFVRGISDPKQFFHRKNFAGHITASGFVLSPDRKRLAVVRHKFLQRYLQPGGHVEETDETVLAAAQREIREETNIRAFRHLPIHADALLPMDIDSHEIPTNPKKNEPGHFHHDFRYLFCVDEEVVPSAPAEDEGEWVWRPVAEAIEEPTFRFFLSKLDRL
jgi:8-oxo-dGTP pyrophosphatase MutT (NUDIX family)